MIATLGILFALVLVGQVFAYIDIGGVKGLKVFLVPPVVFFALGYVAWFDMDGCCRVCVHDDCVLLVKLVEDRRRGIGAKP